MRLHAADLFLLLGLAACAGTQSPAADPGSGATPAAGRAAPVQSGATAAPASTILAAREHDGRYLFVDSAPGAPRSRLFAQDGLREPARMILDEPALAAATGSAFAARQPSPDGRLVAYVGESGADGWREIRLRDVRTGADLPNSVKWVRRTAIAWTHDSDGFFYTCHASPRRGSALPAPEPAERVCYHWVNRAQSDDELIFFEPADRTRLYDVSVTPDGLYAIMEIRTAVAAPNRIYLIDLARAGSPSITAPVVRLIDDPSAVFRVVNGSDLGLLTVFTTDGAPRGRLISIDVNLPRRESWRPLVRESDATLTSVEVADLSLVLHYRDRDRSILRVTSFRGSAQGDIALPGSGVVSEVHGRLEDAELFYRFAAAGASAAIYRYDMRRGTQEPFAPQIPR